MESYVKKDFGVRRANSMPRSSWLNAVRLERSSVQVKTKKSFYRRFACTVPAADTMFGGVLSYRVFV